MLKHTHASVWEKRTTSLQSLGFSSTRVQEIQSAATPREKKISKPGRCSHTRSIRPDRCPPRFTVGGRWYYLIFGSGTKLIVSEVPAPAASCPPERDPPDQLALEEADLSFQSQCRVKLFCLLYTQLIVKSLVYCCGLSLLMILRNKGPSTSCSHAD
ncbi:hypothetical protein PFLUV_G00128590 [Perca fluviatilis]|uniref:Uncharacterized protein n=1 Tax=Perca fluviatilis TaxID=8168 RepID=A0A6A5E3C9_PERFL|nr:hypothetical protein PFLUV_G00128590 [Perca fluviatilis]